mgnify:CR=1 FL=1
MEFLHREVIDNPKRKNLSRRERRIMIIENSKRTRKHLEKNGYKSLIDSMVEEGVSSDRNKCRELINRIAYG